MISESPVQGSVRVLVVGAEHRLTDRLWVLSEQYPDVLVVGTALTGQSGLLAASRANPDVVLVERYLPDAEALLVCECIQEQVPPAAVILISDPQPDRAMLAIVEAGVCGLISPVASDNDVMLTILRAADGELLLPRLVLQRLFRLARDLEHAGPEHQCGCGQRQDSGSGVKG